MNFGYNLTNHWVAHPVTISPSGSSTAGETDYSLTCSSTLFDPIPLPDNVPSPTFQWFFGPNGNASLPSGVIPMATVLSSSNNTVYNTTSNTTSNITINTYSSTLRFSPLSQSHTGMYTCRLGAGRLINNAVVIVNGIIIEKLTNQTLIELIFHSFQHLPSLSTSLQVQLHYWDKVATPSDAMSMELKISTLL